MSRSFVFLFAFYMSLVFGTHCLDIKVKLMPFFPYIHAHSPRSTGLSKIANMVSILTNYIKPTPPLIFVTDKIIFSLACPHYPFHHLLSSLHLLTLLSLIASRNHLSSGHSVLFNQFALTKRYYHILSM